MPAPRDIGYLVADRSAGGGLRGIESEGGRVGRGWRRRLDSRGLALAQALLSFALIALARDPRLLLWQPATSAADAWRLSDVGAWSAAGLYLAVSFGVFLQRRRGLRPVAGAVVLAAPFLFDLLWLLASPAMLAAIAQTIGLSAGTPLAGFAARALVLAAFNLAVVHGLGLAMDERFTRGLRFHGLIVAGAVLAAATPWIADAAASPRVAAAGGFFGAAFAIGAAALAQAGLWAQTHLLTGALLDAIRGHRPTASAARRHAREGLARGAVFGAVFMLLVLAIAAARAPLASEAVFALVPFVVASFAGALLFPFARTVVESFDGSPPFFRRLSDQLLDPTNLARGLVVGAGIAAAFAWALPERAVASRSVVGLVVGAAAYAGVDLVVDALAIATGRRQKRQAARVYGLGAGLGGAVGLALGWYFEATQLAVVGEKLGRYAALVAPPPLGAVPYVVYPWFSKWGALDLGVVTGGVKLFYVESLSGVVGWSIAAPLFSVNLVLWTASIEKSLAPIRRLFSGQGLVAIGEQALRVQRWGLWMAPVIYSFLRLSPEPTWYNQDGAIRSFVAAFEALTLAPADFQRFSLEVFLGLLAYDGLRILIWFDHMGLRVATLVNLSFVGGDALDERAARFLGLGARARVVPEGIRRFATWGPLLIPFYLPRGADWDAAWTGAEAARATGAAFSPPVAGLLRGYVVASIGLAAAAVAGVARERLRRRAARRDPARFADLAEAQTPDLVLANGVMTLALSRGGQGFLRVRPDGAHERELDLTRRPDDPRSSRGLHPYLRDLDAPGAPPLRIGASSLAAADRTASDLGLSQPDPNHLHLVDERAGLRIRIELRLDPVEPVAIAELELENLEDRPRRLELTSYRELALDDADALRRHPRLSSLYVATRFVAPLAAILAHDRRRHGSPRSGRGHPIAYHAVRVGDDPRIRLTGYEDSRTRFVGGGAPFAPRALLEGRARPIEDEGLLHTFDPCASLRLEVELEPRGRAQLRFLDGYVEDERDAVVRIAAQLGCAPPSAAALAPAFSRLRTLDDARRPRRCPRPTRAADGAAPGPAGDSVSDSAVAAGAELPFVFSAEGRTLTIRREPPRPYAHVLANPLGYGVLVNSDGAICSFAGNAQKNALTPFTLDPVPAESPGQAIWVVPLDRADEALVFPWTESPSSSLRAIEYGLGSVVFRESRGELDFALELAVLPDAPVEVRRLVLTNRSDAPLRCRVVFSFEMLLAEVSVDSRGRLEVDRSPDARALFFANPDQDFVAGTAFVATDLERPIAEATRARFFGRAADPSSLPHFVAQGRPDADARDDGFRIAAFAGEVEVPAGGARAVHVVLGQASSIEASRALIAEHLPAVAPGLAAARRRWDDRLAPLRIVTDCPAFDRLVNDWLPYQIQTARLWARAGPDQRSGAYGFRDQLQDVLALLFHDPALARRQILLHAAQQFREGDVLAWWHPSKAGGTGLGARSRASDLHLWLPYAVARYVEATGDRAVLEVEIPFLEAPSIPRGRDGVLVVPRRSRDSASLHEHCRRAIERTLARRGRHGLPLLGSGDWNDALDRAGRRGRGESVWLGFFLHDVLVRFAALEDGTCGAGAGETDRREATRLAAALAGMRRGERFVRLTTDEGEELVRADALTAAWPVLSGAVDFATGRGVVEAALRDLAGDGGLRLTSPPFALDDPLEAGRIAEYPPGVRENGGQYTHGVSWLVDALVRLSETAGALGEASEAARLRARAAEVWLALSPIAATTPEAFERFGLAPHQQAADVYVGPSHGGRGGWSWYTGGAARMLSAAHAILGLRLVSGELVLPDDLFAAKGTIRLEQLTHRERTVRRA